MCSLRLRPSWLRPPPLLCCWSPPASLSQGLVKAALTVVDEMLLLEGKYYQLHLKHPILEELSVQGACLARDVCRALLPSKFGAGRRLSDKWTLRT